MAKNPRIASDARGTLLRYGKDERIHSIRSLDHDGQTCHCRYSVTVELILEKLVAGETMEQILEAHRRLTREAIQAAAEVP